MKSKYLIFSMYIPKKLTFCNLTDGKKVKMKSSRCTTLHIIIKSPSVTDPLPPSLTFIGLIGPMK